MGVDVCDRGREILNPDGRCVHLPLPLRATLNRFGALATNVLIANLGRRVHPVRFCPTAEDPRNRSWIALSPPACSPGRARLQPCHRTPANNPERCMRGREIDIGNVLI